MNPSTHRKFPWTQSTGPEIYRIRFSTREEAVRFSSVGALQVRLNMDLPTGGQQQPILTSASQGKFKIIPVRDEDREVFDLVFFA